MLLPQRFGNVTDWQEVSFRSAFSLLLSCIPPPLFFMFSAFSCSPFFFPSFPFLLPLLRLACLPACLGAFSLCFYIVFVLLNCASSCLCFAAYLFRSICRGICRRYFRAAVNHHFLPNANCEFFHYDLSVSVCSEIHCLFLSSIFHLLAVFRLVDAQNEQEKQA
eukprot:RCo014260